jgi:hypothetical protein
MNVQNTKHPPLWNVITVLPVEPGDAAELREDHFSVNTITEMGRLLLRCPLRQRRALLSQAWQ